MKGNEFLSEPGRGGTFGALLDETARATEELCDLVETKTPEEFVATRESEDPDTVSLQSICRHCVNAAYVYSNYIRAAVDQPEDRSPLLGEGFPATPSDFRGEMKKAIRHTEVTLASWFDMDEEKAAQITFQVRWGPTYDAEMILEHGIVHLLRHRRQIERWDG